MVRVIPSVQIYSVLGLTLIFFLFLEQFEQALEDLECALQLAQGLYEPQDRRLSEAFFNYGCALDYVNRSDKAMEYLNQAVMILRSRVILLESEVHEETAVSIELDELRHLIPDIEAKVRVI
jgi:tetratricopeptide (TPR) repeat protein